MKKIIAVAALAGGLSVCAMAEEWTGYIIDQACAGKKEMLGNAACAKSCIKRGSPAVLVSDDGTVYKIADQKEVVDHAGQKVTIAGKMENGEIKVDSVK
ncbi:MAG TPA: DUF5818 domain-containing protein [Bryobacteraceae bacterium]